MHCMKVFGLGLNRTGTSSLNEALLILGYKSIQNCRPMVCCKDGEVGLKTEKLDNIDALTDIPVPLKYRELDKAFPGSKFILTTRDFDSWMHSCEGYYTKFRAFSRKFIWGKRMALYFKNLYGREVFDAQEFSEAYKRHSSEVEEYFSGREEDLLVYSVCNGDGWKPLCEFLNKPVPDASFPHANKLKTLRNYVPSEVVRILRRFKSF